jgi:hypothetical protein
MGPWASPQHQAATNQRANDFDSNWTTEQGLFRLIPSARAHMEIKEKPEIAGKTACLKNTRDPVRTIHTLDPSCGAPLRLSPKFIGYYRIAVG